MAVGWLIVLSVSKGYSAQMGYKTSVSEGIKITCGVGNFYNWRIDLPQTVIKHLQSQILTNTLCISTLAGELTSERGLGLTSVSYLSVCAPVPYISIKISLYTLSWDCNLLNRWLLKSVLFLDGSLGLQEALKAAGALSKRKNPRTWYEEGCQSYFMP